jgi:hypothetical protein
MNRNVSTVDYNISRFFIQMRTRDRVTSACQTFRTGRSQGNLARTPDMGVVTPLNNPGGPEGDTVTVARKLLNTEY